MGRHAGFQRPRTRGDTLSAYNTSFFCKFLLRTCEKLEILHRHHTSVPVIVASWFRLGIPGAELQAHVRLLVLRTPGCQCGEAHPERVLHALIIRTTLCNVVH